MCTSYSSVQLYKKLPRNKQYGWDDYRLKDIQTRHDPTMDWADLVVGRIYFPGIDSRLQHVYMAGGELHVKNFEDVHTT